MQTSLIIQSFKGRSPAVARLYIAFFCPPKALCRLHFADLLNFSQSTYYIISPCFVFVNNLTTIKSLFFNYFFLFLQSGIFLSPLAKKPASNRQKWSTDPISTVPPNIYPTIVLPCFSYFIKYKPRLLISGLLLHYLRYIINQIFSLVCVYALYNIIWSIKIYIPSRLH